MIFGIGIDTIEVPRIAKSIATYGDQFVLRIFSAGEIAYSAKRPHAAEHFAARFAAKEAFAKALGTGVRRGFTWKEVSVSHEMSGKPFIALEGRMVARAKQVIGAEFRIQLSLTHTKEIAEAIVTIELVE
ncbi:MAG: holo-ACP synthase [Candidatus Kapaibacterium sp.]|jgi:holo-[acyl-carrier protein] synthase